MTRVTIIYRNNLISGFKLIGHADSADYGHDIVCAAASVLSITTLQSLASIAHVRPDVKKRSARDGVMIVSIPKVRNHARAAKAQTLLRSFELGIKMIADQYHRYLKLNIIR